MANLTTLFYTYYKYSKTEKYVFMNYIKDSAETLYWTDRNGFEQYNSKDDIISWGMTDGMLFSNYQETIACRL